MSPLSVDLIKKLFFYLFCKKGKAKKFLVLNKVFYQNKLNQKNNLSTLNCDRAFYFRFRK